MSGTSERTEREDDSHPGTLYAPKEEVDIIASWAEHFEVGDTIQWAVESVDGVHESEIIGFSTMDTLALPVVEYPDVLGDDAAPATATVSENVWVPEETQSVAHIEMEYTQTMTVKIPVEEMPASETDAFHLVKNTDPEFVADVLPNRWDDAVSVGQLDVVDIGEEEVGKR